MNEKGARITQQEKHEIYTLMKNGQNDPEIAKQMDRSIHTIRKWRRRIERTGVEGKHPGPGRPRKGALSTYPKTLRNKIKSLRKSYPGWGPQSILIELKRDPVWGEQELPSRSRIGVFLNEAGLTRRYLKTSDIVQPEKTFPTRAHQIWEMDAQTGVRVEGLGKVSFIHVLDKASRLKIESTPLLRVQKPGTNHYMLALRRAFLNWGRPEQITLDRDTVFYDNTYPSPFPTRIHRWLIALGVDVDFTRSRRPTDHAQIERSHRTMTAQAVEGQRWESLEALWMGLDERRAVLNQWMPCVALEGKAPLEAFPEASFSGRGYWLEDELSLLSMEKLYGYLSQGVWFRLSTHGAIQLGGHRYWISIEASGQSLKITFSPAMRWFVVRSEKKEGLFYVHPKGMSKQDLMGDLQLLNQLPAYQLPLPLFQREQSVIQLANILTGTN